MQQIGGFNGRVADAPSDNWVYRILPPWLWPYAQLARWDRPIGWQLLMWPCFWSVALAANAAAAQGLFSGRSCCLHLFLYFIGAVAMRGAGCTYNDLVDHEIDMEVARTRSRPLPSGRVTRPQAKIFIGAAGARGPAGAFAVQLVHRLSRRAVARPSSRSIPLPSALPTGRNSSSALPFPGAR